MRARPSYRLRGIPLASLSARGLTKSFARGLARAVRRTVALDEIDIDVRAGELLGLVGSEAAGKTTLLQCLCGLLKRDGGVIELAGEPFDGGGCPPQIAYVPAVPVFYPFLTVRDVLEFRLARHGSASHSDHPVDRVLTALDLHRESRCRISVLPRDVIGRIAVAEAFLGEPDVILVDTGPAAHCHEVAAATLDALKASADAGAAIVFAAREVSSIARVASRMVFIDRGRIGRAFSAGPLCATLNQPVEPVGSLFVAERVH